MSNLIAKIKNNKKNPFKLVISGEEIYDLKISNTLSFPEYDADHNLDEDSWFKVENFSNQTYFLDFLNFDFDPKEYQALEKKEFNEIAYICAIQNSDFYFQKITPSLFIKKKLISFGEVAEIEESSEKLILNNTPDAVYLKSIDTIIFKSISTISSIFQGIDILYKEATNDQVAYFLNQNFIKKSPEFTTDKVSKANRKRIALALATLEKMTESDKVEIFNYIEDYCKGKLFINMNESTCVISNDDELKNLIYGIEQRFYTTPFSKEKRLANSVQKINQ